MTAKGYELDRATCPVCGREVVVDTPRKGDGSVQVLRRHPNRPAPRCEGSRRPRPGQWMGNWLARPRWLPLPLPRPPARDARP